MYISTYYIQNIVLKNVHVIIRICELQKTILLLAHPLVMSMIR